MGPSCFAGCVQVVDFYHAMEHAGAVLQVLLGTKEHTDYKRRLRRWAKRLLKDGVEKLIAQSREEAESLGRSAAVEKELGYFVGNVARMQYGSFRAQGYFIGSGVVEAGCKTAIGSRCNERFHRSGLSQEGFARRYGLKVSRLRYWLYHPRWRRASASGAPRWQEIRINGWPATPSWGAEISLPGGCTVRLQTELARELMIPLLAPCAELCSPGRRRRGFSWPWIRSIYVNRLTGSVRGCSNA